MPTHSKKLDYTTEQIGKNENEDGYQITPQTITYSAAKKCKKVAYLRSYLARNISVRNDSSQSQLSTVNSLLTVRTHQTLLLWRLIGTNDLVDVSHLSEAIKLADNVYQTAQALLAKGVSWVIILEVLPRSKRPPWRNPSFDHPRQVL